MISKNICTYVVFLVVNSFLFVGCGGSSKISPDILACEKNGIYIDSIDGSDANLGDSSCSPWKTLSKVSPSSLSSNTTVYLKRGSVFYDRLLIDKNNVTVDAYGDGARPIIDGSVEINEFENLGNNLYRAQIVKSIVDRQGLGNISENGVMLRPVNWDTDFVTTETSLTNGSFSYDFTSQDIYIRTTSVPSESSYRASFQLYGVQVVQGVNNILINNLHIKRFSLHGIEFKDCDGCEVHDVRIENGGGAVVAVLSGGTRYLYAGNGIEFDHASKNGIVDDAFIANIFDSCISPQTYENNKVASGFLFTNLALDKCGFAGIEISVLSNGGKTGSSIGDVTISNATITRMGRGWSEQRYGSEGYGIRIASDSNAGAGVISNTVINNVTISDSINSGIRIVGDTGVTTITQSNIFNNSGSGIDLSEPVAVSPKLLVTTSLIHGNNGFGINYNCANCQGINLYHNTFYDNFIINLAIMSPSASTLIKNNVFFSSQPMTHLYSVGTLNNAEINYNCYKKGINLFGYNGNAYSTLSDFTLATSFEENGIGDDLVTMTNPDEDDFTLRSDSSCRTSGVLGLDVYNDYVGTNYQNPPSAGAYQY